MMIDATTLPTPADDLDRAEHDLAMHGIGAVTDVLSGDTLTAVRTLLAQTCDAG